MGGPKKTISRQEIWGDSDLTMLTTTPLLLPIPLEHCAQQAEYILADYPAIFLLLLY